MDAFFKKVKPAEKPAQPDVEMATDNHLMATAQAKPKYVPWIEKYRPSKVEEVSHQLEVVSALRHSVQTGQVPHLLMYGPPGTGKTSTILALAKDLFGQDFYKQRVLELNASDERGIAVVREKVKKFAQRKIAKHPDGRQVPQLQFVILDEADSMTTDAQAALRRIIEAHATTTRFCIICNYISKIIDPLASRCVKFRFSPISVEAQRTRLLQICQNEGVNLETDSVLDKLIQVTEGDLRRSINTLQTCSSFGKDQQLTAAHIESVSGVVPHSVVLQIEQVLSKAASYSDVQKLAEDLILEGYDCQQMLLQVQDHLCVNSTKVADIKRAKIAEMIAATDFNLLTGGNEELNLLNALSHIGQILTGK